MSSNLRLVYNSAHSVCISIAILRYPFLLLIFLFSSEQQQRERPGTSRQTTANKPTWRCEVARSRHKPATSGAASNKSGRQVTGGPNQRRTSILREGHPNRASSGVPCQKLRPHHRTDPRPHHCPGSPSQEAPPTGETKRPAHSAQNPANRIATGRPARTDTEGTTRNMHDTGHGKQMNWDRAAVCTTTTAGGPSPFSHRDNQYSAVLGPRGQVHHNHGRRSTVVFPHFTVTPTRCIATAANIPLFTPLLHHIFHSISSGESDRKPKSDRDDIR